MTTKDTKELREVQAGLLRILADTALRSADAFESGNIEDATGKYKAFLTMFAKFDDLLAENAMLVTEVETDLSEDGSVDALYQRMDTICNEEIARHNDELLGVTRAVYGALGEDARAAMEQDVADTGNDLIRELFEQVKR